MIDPALRRAILLAALVLGFCVLAAVLVNGSAHADPRATGDNNPSGGVLEGAARTVTAPVGEGAGSVPAGQQNANLPARRTATDTSDVPSTRPITQDHVHAAPGGVITEPVIESAATLVGAAPRPARSATPEIDTTTSTTSTGTAGAQATASRGAGRPADGAHAAPTAPAALVLQPVAGIATPTVLNVTTPIARPAAAATAVQPVAAGQPLLGSVVGHFAGPVGRVLSAGGPLLRAVAVAAGPVVAPVVGAAASAAAPLVAGAAAMTGPVGPAAIPLTTARPLRPALSIVAAPALTAPPGTPSGHLVGPPAPRAVGAAAPRTDAPGGGFAAPARASGSSTTGGPAGDVVPLPAAPAAPGPVLPGEALSAAGGVGLLPALLGSVLATGLGALVVPLAACSRHITWWYPEVAVGPD